MQGSELEPDTLEIVVVDAAVAAERILDAEEVAAVLVPEPAAAARPQPPPSPRPKPSPPPRAAIARPTRSPGAADGLPATQQLAAEPSPRARLQAAQAEIERLQRQMRARDAYLAELEQALQTRTRQLEASGLGSVEDAYSLLGRVRGQAFRIAELESEIRQMELRLSTLSRLVPAKPQGLPDA